MVEKIDLVTLYYNFTSWCNDLITIKNRNAITTLSNMVNNVTNKFSPNSCDFLDDMKVNNQISKIVDESIKQMSTRTQITEKDNQEQLDYIKCEVFKLKISDYVNQNKDVLKKKIEL